MIDTRTILLSAVISSLCILTTGLAQAMEPEPPFHVAAEAAVLINPHTSKIICAKNPDTPIAPASLTKLMTLVIAYDEIDNGYASLDDQVAISEKAWRTGGSKMFVAVNSTVPLRQLLEGIAVVSGNDACVAVAEHIAGVEEAFVEKMNRKASEIGMHNTVFKNSHGLPDGQNSTARDMALLACYYIKRHPETLQMHATKEMTYSGITQQNRNGLLWLDSGFDGLKTGWFSSAGYHIVATAHQDQDRFIAVVMGAGSARQRESIAQQLIRYGFRNFNTVTVLNPEETLGTVTVVKGREDLVAFGAAHALKLTLPRHTIDDIVVQHDLDANTVAPVTKGTELGTASVVLEERELATVPLVALNDIERAGAIKLFLQTIKASFAQPPYWGFLLLGLLLAAAFIAKAAARRKKNKPSGFSRHRRGDGIL